MYDEQKLGWLNISQTKKFFATVLDLNFKKKKHQKFFTKILRIVNAEKNNFVLKERILSFFEVSGFSIIHELCQEQMEIERENQALGAN